MNEDNVAPWKVDGRDSDGSGFEDSEIEEGGRGGTTLGINDVTTATGCAVSLRSARIFWESPRALMLLAARLKEDERFAVASATAKRDMFRMRPGTLSLARVDVCTC